ncbi:21069_t:CDS:2, partial [Dentiscutata erythropus]
VLALLSVSMAVSYHRTLIHYAISKLQDQFPNNNRIFQHDGVSSLYSPYLNSIENLWSEIEAKLQKRRLRPGNLNELERMIKEE